MEGNMQIHGSDGLEARIRKLEQECRRLRHGAGLLLLVVAVLPLMGQAKSSPEPGGKTVEAQHFVVRDDQGQVRAAMGVYPNGSVGLSFIGQNRVNIGANLDGGGLTILDSTGKPRVVLAIRGDGSAGLDLLSAEGKRRVGMNLRSDESPAVELHSKDGRVRASLVVQSPDELAGFLLTDASGKVRGALAVDPQGSASLDLMDRLEKRRLSLGVKAEGAPSFTLLDEKGLVLERHPTLR
jgi:hypothetical protein